MEEYLAWLNSDRRVRELHFKLSLFFAKVRGKFSYLRTTGLTELINFVKGLKDDELKFFLRLQDVQEENVCHLVFKTLVIPICDAAQLTKESKQELYLALELLQGVCLLHHPSKKVAADLNAIPLLQELLERDQPQIQVAALECLLAVLVDCDDHQQFFRDNKGIDKVTAILRQKNAKKDVRSKCAEFLVFLIRYFAGGGAGENKKRVVSILGEKLTQLLTQSVQLNPTKEKGEKFDSFIRELDKHSG